VAAPAAPPPSKHAEPVFGILLRASSWAGHVVDLQFQALDLAGEFGQLLLELRRLQLLLGSEVAATTRHAGAGAGNLVLQIEHLLLSAARLRRGGRRPRRHGRRPATRSPDERKAAGCNPAAPAQKPPRGMTHHFIILLLGAAPAASWTWPDRRPSMRRKHGSRPSDFRHN
jgi:hypothetical protein